MKKLEVKHKDGWHYNPDELRKLTERVNGQEYGEAMSMEEVEAVLLAIDESLSTETGQQGVDGFKRILDKHGFDFDAFEYENEFSAKAILNAMKEVSSQPQEGQDELWDEISDKFQSWIDNDFDERAASDVTEQELKSKFTIIKK